MKVAGAFSLVITAACICAADVRAQEVPIYTLEHAVNTPIRIWGPAEMSAVTRYWTDGFKRFHPQATIETTLKGSAAAVPGLYSGKADIALLGRENNLTDNNGFGRVKQYKPLRIELMGGSLDVPGKSPALVVYVHADNPLGRMTLDQLDAVFGHEHRRGLASMRTWGDLGLKGEWANAPIRLYAYDLRTGTGSFFRNAVLGGSHKLNWDGLIEYRDTRRSDGTLRDAAEAISRAASGDRHALAISSLRYQGPDLKSVALAAKAGDTFQQATQGTLIDRSYPLARSTYAFIDVPPGQKIDPDLREFLRYALSREGQADVLRDCGYLPMSAERVAVQRQALDAVDAVAEGAAR